MGLLNGKVAFITGGASGIGEGASMVIADMQADRGQAICEEFQGGMSMQ